VDLSILRDSFFPRLIAIAMGKKDTRDRRGRTNKRKCAQPLPIPAQPLPIPGILSDANQTNAELLMTNFIESETVSDLTISKLDDLKAEISKVPYSEFNDPLTDGDREMIADEFEIRRLFNYPPTAPLIENAAGTLNPPATTTSPEVIRDFTDAQKQFLHVLVANLMCHIDDTRGLEQCFRLIRHYVKNYTDNLGQLPARRLEEIIDPAKQGRATTPLAAARSVRPYHQRKKVKSNLLVDIIIHEYLPPARSSIVTIPQRTEYSQQITELCDFWAKERRREEMRLATNKV
jgi:hypothetical protein